MHAAQRRDEIHRIATVEGPASVEELAVRFAVSPSTIRRDLAMLHEAGKLARTYGGAVALPSHAETTLRDRMGEAFAAKQAIARFAAQDIAAGETVLLDGGSTVGALAHELVQRRDLTVVTPALSVLTQLADAPHVTVQCLGGRLRPVSQTLLGPWAELILERVTFDKAYLGADAVTAELGICEADQEQTRIKEIFARRAREVYVLADGSKLGRQPFHAWLRLPLPWTLVTDSSADAAEVAALRAAGVTVAVVALPAGTPIFPDPVPGRSGRGSARTATDREVPE